MQGARSAKGDIGVQWQLGQGVKRLQLHSGILMVLKDVRDPFDPMATIAASPKCFRQRNLYLWIVLLLVNLLKALRQGMVGSGQDQQALGCPVAHNWRRMAQRH